MKPYKGYDVRVEVDVTTDSLHGYVAGTRDVIAFEGKDFASLEKAFHEAVDDYIAWCKEKGETPEKPRSGKFVVRIAPELHRQVVSETQRSGQSINSFVTKCIETGLETSRLSRMQSSSETKKSRSLSPC